MAIRAKEIKGFLKAAQLAIFYCATLRLPTLGYTFVSPLISCAFAAVTPARESDHRLPGLAVKNETDASSLGEVYFF